MEKVFLVWYSAHFLSSKEKSTICIYYLFYIITFPSTVQFATE